MISILVGTAAFTAGPALSLAGTQRAQPVMQSVNWDRHAGGCTPFAEFNGGGSAAVSSGVQAKWAQGGDNHMRRANPTDTHMVSHATPQTQDYGWHMLTLYIELHPVTSASPNARSF